MKAVVANLRIVRKAPKKHQSEKKRLTWILYVTVLSLRRIFRHSRNVI